MSAAYYNHDDITIMHADALEVLPHVAAGSIDVVLTDPPYMIGAVSAGNLNSKAGGWHDMMNSALWFATWYREVARIRRHAGVFWTFCNWRSLPVVMRAMSDADLAMTSALVWDKEWIGPGGLQGLRPSYEMVAMSAGAGFALPNRGLPDIWRSQWSASKPNGHPAEKPVDLLVRILQESASPGDLVLDPFMGCGSTLVAAQLLGMRAVGIEADEKWCEIAARRLAQEVLPFDAPAPEPSGRPVDDVADVGGRV